MGKKQDKICFIRFPSCFAGKRQWERGNRWETWVLGPEPGHKFHQASLTPLERVSKALSISQRIQRLEKTQEVEETRGSPCWLRFLPQH